MAQTPPLNLGSNLTLSDATAAELAELLTCGALDIDLLNKIFMTIGCAIDALAVSGNGVAGTNYDEATNILTIDWENSQQTTIDFTAIIADAVATGLITGDSYDPVTNILTLTTAGGNTIELDMTGVLADALSDAVLPAGMIVMRADNAVPAGWALCDGTNGTPDLTDSFIIGAGANVVGSTGGSIDHNHAITVNNAATGVTANHGFDPNVDGGGGTANVALNPVTINDPQHNHNATSAATNHLPPFYALIFVMKT